MELGEIISMYRKEAGMTIDELSEKSGVPKGTINKIIGGVTKAPTLENMRSIVYALGKTLSDLEEQEHQNSITSNERQMIKKYRVLDEHGKKIVDIVLDEEYKYTIEARKEATRQQTAGENISYFYIPEYREPASAGTGQPIGTVYPETITLIKEPPLGTSFIAHVHGDSMKPEYEDGDMIFVHAQNEIRVGQVGLFFMAGEEFIKELGDGELLSHNPAYEPVELDESIRCQGLVLGICDESYLEEV